MLLSRNAKIALTAFVVFDVLVAAWLVYLFVLRSEVNEIGELRELGATRYPEPRPIAEFQLTDQQGNSFRNQDLLGQWSMVFFGFTSCPDVCPITMTELSQFYRQWNSSDDREAPQIVFVTVDPERDSVEAVAEYMDQFEPDFIGLSGDAEAIAHTAQQFFVAYSSEVDMGHEGHMAPTMDPDDYMVSHSTHVSLVNPQGQLHSVIRPPIRSEVLMGLFPQLIAD